MFKIMLTAAEIRTLNSILDGGFSNKIPAIKHVRGASRHQVPGMGIGGTALTRSNIGLREAKEAVETLMADRGMKDGDNCPVLRPPAPSACIVPFQPIRSITVNMGGGDVIVDMDELSLKFTEGLTSLPIADVKRLFDLWQRIKDWEDSQ